MIDYIIYEDVVYKFEDEILDVIPDHQIFVLGPFGQAVRVR